MRGFSRRLAPITVAPVALALLLSGSLARAAAPFAISLEGNDGNPVVNVRLSLGNGVSHLSDSNGRIYFYEPGAMNHRIRFTVECSAVRTLQFAESYPDP